MTDGITGFMRVTVPGNYLVTVEETNYMAEYEGSGREFKDRFGFQPKEAAERYPVPEGVLMCAPELGSCQLFTGEPDEEQELYEQGSPHFHFYRLKAIDEAPAE